MNTTSEKLKSPFYQQIDYWIHGESYWLIGWGIYSIPYWNPEA